MTSEQRPPVLKRKLGRVIDKHGLHDFHDRLPAMWLGEDGYSETSVRRLAELVNIKVIHSHLEDAIDDPIDGEAEDILKRLKSEDPDKQIGQEQRLEKLGIDPEELRNEFISHQSMYRYLTVALELEKEEDMSNIKEETLRSFRNLSEKQKLIAENKLKTLSNNDELDVDPEDIDVTILMYQNCSECFEQHSVLEFAEHGGCPNRK